LLYIVIIEAKISHAAP